jgi:hypothetical protein
MRIYRPAAACIAAALAATALALVTCLPSEAAAGTGWQIVSRTHFGTPTVFNGLFGLAAVSPASAWAVGGTDIAGSTAGAPVAEQWDGTSWQRAALPAGLTNTLGAVSAPATDDAWAVSQLGGYVLHWNGTTWSVAKTFMESPPLSQELTGVTAFGPGNVWVFGAPGAFPGLGTWHFTGGTWHRVTGLARGILEASALSRRSMWAIGSDSVAPDDIILRFNGTAWQQITSPVLTGLQFFHILALSASNIWVLAAVPGHPQELVHFDGKQWSTVPVTVPSHVFLDAMTADGHGGLWFGGARSFSTTTPWVAHRSAAGTWTSRRLPSGPGSAFDITRIPGTTSLWAAGNLQTATGANAVVWGRGPAT